MAAGPLHKSMLKVDYQNSSKNSAELTLPQSTQCIKWNVKSLKCTYRCATKSVLWTLVAKNLYLWLWSKLI